MQIKELGLTKTIWIKCISKRIKINLVIEPQKFYQLPHACLSKKNLKIKAIIINKDPAFSGLQGQKIRDKKNLDVVTSIIIM